MFPVEFLPWYVQCSLAHVFLFRHHFVRDAFRRLLLGAGIAILCVPECGAVPPVQQRASRTTIPATALEVYRHVLRTGRAPAGYVGGRVWNNREHSLPPGGKYREFDIHPKIRGRNRGAERIIVETTTRRGWYTADHYRTFVRIEGP
jgi:hypothetical protein